MPLWLCWYKTITLFPHAQTPLLWYLSRCWAQKKKTEQRAYETRNNRTPPCCAPQGTWELCKWVKMTRFRQKYLCCLVRLFNYKYTLGEVEEFSPLRNILDWIESSTMVGIRWWWHSCVYALKKGLHEVKNKCMMFSLYLYYTLGEKPWGRIYAQTCKLCWKQQHGVKQVFSGLSAYVRTLRKIWIFCEARKTIRHQKNHRG